MTLEDIDFNKIYYRYDEKRLRHVFQIIEPGEQKDSIFRRVCWWDRDDEKLVTNKDEQCWREDFITIPFLHQATLEDKIFIIKSLFYMKDIEDRS